MSKFSLVFYTTVTPFYHISSFRFFWLDFVTQHSWQLEGSIIFNSKIVFSRQLLCLLSKLVYHNNISSQIYLQLNPFSIVYPNNTRLGIAFCIKLFLSVNYKSTLTSFTIWSGKAGRTFAVVYRTWSVYKFTGTVVHTWVGGTNVDRCNSIAIIKALMHSLLLMMWDRLRNKGLIANYSVKVLRIMFLQRKFQKPDSGIRNVGSFFKLLIGYGMILLQCLCNR